MKQPVISNNVRIKKKNMSKLHSIKPQLHSINPPTHHSSKTMKLVKSFSFSKPKKTLKNSTQCSGSNVDNSNDCFYYHEDYSMAEWYMDEQSLIFCDKVTHDEECETVFGTHPTLRDVLRSAVCTLGESCMGLTEKVVLVRGKIFAMKRFRLVSLSKGRFGRRVERLSFVSRKSRHLVPIVAYLYSKRIKFVMHEHFPMGSLGDLLQEGRKGKTVLDWPQRLTIITHLVLAITYIHNQTPRIKNMQMNVHGNIKSSNIMIRHDFSACLSNYGFTQLAIPDTQHINTSSDEVMIQSCYTRKASQSNDVYDFGVVVLEMIGGVDRAGRVECIKEHKEEIKNGELEFFEVELDLIQRNQALVVLDVALACVDEVAEARPSMNCILNLDLFRKYSGL